MRASSALPPSRSTWPIFENNHEPIIDQETFDIVQRIRDGRRSEMPIRSGMLFCADCGAAPAVAGERTAVPGDALAIRTGRR